MVTHPVTRHKEGWGTWTPRPWHTFTAALQGPLASEKYFLLIFLGELLGINCSPFKWCKGPGHSPSLWQSTPDSRKWKHKIASNKYSNLTKASFSEIYWCLQKVQPNSNTRSRISRFIRADKLSLAQFQMPDYMRSLNAQIKKSTYKTTLEK